MCKLAYSYTIDGLFTAFIEFLVTPRNNWTQINFICLCSEGDINISISQTRALLVRKFTLNFTFFQGFLQNIGQV